MVFKARAMRLRLFAVSRSIATNAEALGSRIGRQIRDNAL
jgi:hypothetical protein